MDRTLLLAWAAGFIDGEGFVGLSRGVNKKTGRPCHQPIIDVSQRVRLPLDKLVGIFGGNVRVGKATNGNEMFYWRVAAKQARQVLAEVRPYLIVKRQQADLLMQFVDTLPGKHGQRVGDEVLRQREAIHAALRVLNHRRAPHQPERLSEPTPCLTLVRPAVNG